MELSSDRRLVRTFAATLSIFLEQRYQAAGMLLEEPGAFPGGFDAPLPRPSARAIG